MPHAHSDPAVGAVPVVLDAAISTNNYPCRALYIGVAGDVTAVVGGVAVLFKNVPVGILPVRCTKVNSSGTAATDMVALF
jgi:hypothetical protein